MSVFVMPWLPTTPPPPSTYTAAAYAINIVSIISFRLYTNGQVMITLQCTESLFQFCKWVDDERNALPTTTTTTSIFDGTQLQTSVERMLVVVVVVANGCYAYL